MELNIDTPSFLRHLLKGTRLTAVFSDCVRADECESQCSSRWECLLS